MQSNREASSRFLSVTQVNRSRNLDRSFGLSEGRCVATAFYVTSNLFLPYFCVANFQHIPH
jgi:hypothetical protein